MQRHREEQPSSEPDGEIGQKSGRSEQLGQARQECSVQRQREESDRAEQAQMTELNMGAAAVISSRIMVEPNNCAS